ncbi:unnamed protein product [Linum trigynum]|uniref:Uncharacterized protein n=1 Tax=Linum trigynum TaxID=586398 RepID=A0AAV2GDT0_9ROSI
MTIVKYPPPCDVDLIDAPLNGEINVTVKCPPPDDVDLIDAPLNGEINVTVKCPPPDDVDLIDAPLTSNQHDRYYDSHVSKLRSNECV